ncbi:sigma-70 family RNA polymerase sigma factor [Isoptericola croceus]|uniref:sigma-70 family RNA polymerase sigma factor n=1 Tax=Isoptericola croceus TaxID=3031406 RepID=UPI0023F951A6|nr:sigma-70 family RNA polymerase sigma factor [Isoptericola croceus]
MIGAASVASVDAGTVVRAQHGDSGALQDVVAASLPLVYGVVGRGLGISATGSSGDVDDVVQETMLRAVSSLSDLQQPERFRSWLVAIAYRQMQEHHRARRRRPVPHDLVDDGYGAMPDPVDVADRAVASVVLDDQRRSLALAARWLDPAHQGVLGLWWQETSGGLGRGDLARALGVDRRHAAVRVQRMRAQLDVARGVVVALGATPRCAALDDAATGWDGTPNPLWRKRLHRHVRRCTECLGRQHGLVAPEHLVPAAGLLPVPAALAASVHGLASGAASGDVAAAASSAHGWWQHLVEQVRHGGEAVTAAPAAAVTAAVTAASVAVVGGGVAVTAWVAPDRPDVVVTSVAEVPPAEVPPADPVEPPPPTSPTRGVATADLYVAPDGSDAAGGSYAHPFASLAHAVGVVRPGQTIALRGGTYELTAPVEITTDGAPGARIVLSGYRDETPVLVLDGVPADQWPLVHRAARWTVQALEITGSRSHAYVCLSCVDTVFQDLNSHGNARSGLLLRGDGTVGNQVLDSVFADNHDDASRGDAGIGLGVTFGSGEGNVVAGNRFVNNADDGVDLAGFASPVTLRDNVAVGNGFNRWGIADWRGNGGGFTLGGGEDLPVAAHVLVGNVARGNGHHGFADGGNTGVIRLTGNEASDNGVVGYDLRASAAVLDGSTAAGNGVAGRLGDQVVLDAVAASW